MKFDTKSSKIEKFLPKIKSWLFIKDWCKSIQIHFSTYRLIATL